VSKVFGYVLLIGLVGAVLLSIGLLMFEWIRSANEPANATPVPPVTKAALLRSPESLGYVLVDARQVVASAGFSALEG
jgi:hypothetical protein